MCQEFIGLLVPLCTDNEVLKAMVGGQSRCDGWTVRYETVVGYFELEHLLREREEGGGSRICPLCSSAAHKCPKQCGQRCQLGGREGVAEIRQGAGRSQRPAGAGSGAYISISVTVFGWQNQRQRQKQSRQTILAQTSKPLSVSFLFRTSARLAQLHIINSRFEVL